MAVHPCSTMEAHNSSSMPSSVITRSAELGRLLNEAGVERGKLHTIYNGVDTELFRPRARDAARDALGWGREGRLLLFVGNLLPIKDPLFLLRAFAAFFCCNDENTPGALPGRPNPTADDAGSFIDFPPASCKWT